MSNNKITTLDPSVNSDIVVSSNGANNIVAFKAGGGESEGVSNSRLKVACVIAGTLALAKPTYNGTPGDEEWFFNEPIPSAVNDPDIARAEIEESCRGVLTAESCGTLLENLEQNFRHLEYDQNCANDVEPIDCNLDSLVHQEFLHALKFHNNRLENQDITSNDITSADLEASLENIQALCEQKKGEYHPNCYETRITRLLKVAFQLDFIYRGWNKDTEINRARSLKIMNRLGKHIHNLGTSIQGDELGAIARRSTEVYHSNFLECLEAGGKGIQCQDPERACYVINGQQIDDLKNMSPVNSQQYLIDSFVDAELCTASTELQSRYMSDTEINKHLLSVVNMIMTEMRIINSLSELHVVDQSYGGMCDTKDDESICGRNAAEKAAVASGIHFVDTELKRELQNYTIICGEDENCALSSFLRNLNEYLIENEASYMQHLK